MKVVLCGPPHSGKSVLLKALYDFLPAKVTQFIFGCPDGESIISNNYDQRMIQIIRRKGVFDEKFVSGVIERIKSNPSPILIVDTGGKISSENERIFAEVDACIIVSSDKEKKKEWEEFAQKCGVDIIASIDSELIGTDIVRTEEEHITGTITGLDRGKEKECTPLIESIVTKVIKSSGVNLEENLQQKFREFNNRIGNARIIDMQELAQIVFKLPLKMNGDIDWKSGEKIKEIHDFLKVKFKGLKENGIREVYFVGCKPVWLSALVSNILESVGITYSAFFSIARDNWKRRSGIIDGPNEDRFTVSKRIRVEKMRPEHMLEGGVEVYKIMPDNSFELVKYENNDSVILRLINDRTRFLSPTDLEKMILPYIDPDKKIYFSGSMTQWMVASFIRSYPNNEKAIWEAGVTYHTIASADENNIGKKENTPPNIDFEKILQIIRDYQTNGITIDNARKGEIRNEDSVEH